MNLDNVNKWLTLGSNIGVLAGIIALVIELNQSTRLAQVEAYQTRSSEIQTTFVQLAHSPELIEVLNKYDNQGIASLNETEFRQVRSWNSAVIRRMESQYYQYINGFLEEEVVEKAFNIIVNGAYDRWSELGIIDTIDNSQWRREIEQRVEAKL